MKTISFCILFSTLQLFFNPLFFPFLQQFTAGENLRVAGDSAGRRRILTTLHKGEGKKGGGASAMSPSVFA